MLIRKLVINFSSALMELWLWKHAKMAWFLEKELFIIIVVIIGTMRQTVLAKNMIVSFYIKTEWAFLKFANFLATPISNGICEYLFGIYEDSPECSTTYVKCEFGVPHQLPCTKGLVYDERIKGCNWPDLLLEKCNPEAVIGFKCPAKVDPRSQAAKFWPFPRFPGTFRHFKMCFI